MSFNFNLWNKFFSPTIGKIGTIDIGVPEAVKVVISKPAVILYIGRRKYVAKCHAEDEFNPEVGLMMCFTKAYGMNYHKLQHLLNNATVYNTDKNDDAEETNVEELTEAPTLYAIKCTKKGRNLDKVVSFVDKETGKVIYGTTPLTFITKRRATNFIKKYNLSEEAEVIETTLEVIEL